MLCNHLNHKKCAKISQNNKLNRGLEYICAESFAETFPFTKTSTNELLENTYNSNFICKCLNKRGKSKLNPLDHELLILNELRFSKNGKYAQNDPDENLTDSTQF